MNISKKLLLGASLLTVLSSCTDNSQFPGFEKTEDGLYYQLHQEAGAEQAILSGDIVTLDLRYTTNNDSVLYSSELAGQPTMLKVLDPKYKGDIMEGFMMLNVGDSAVFLTSADSFYTKIANQPLPAFIDSNSYLKFYVKIQKAQTEEALMAEREAEAQASRLQEMEKLQNYISLNEITESPTESGLYYVETVPGTGSAVERGQTVKVHYKGMLLDGRVFDSSYDRGEPLEFAIGTGQVIRGWDEGIGYMKEGGKATLVIPSDLAYGPQSPRGSIIEPYSTLVFEVELIEVSNSSKMSVRNTIILIIGLALISCKAGMNQSKRNKVGKEYTTESGLKYVILEEGKGEKAQNGDLVQVHYTGKLTNDTVFDSSVERGKPFSFKLGGGQVIQGWDEGIALLSVGDKAKFEIPSELGYGDRSVGTIPANSTLIFEVELLDVRKPAKPFDVTGKDTVKLESGLQYIKVVSNPDGAQPAVGNDVKVHYSGYLEDGKMFDSSVDRGDPFVFPLGKGRVIKGWDEGVALLKTGEKARFIIPHTLGYGERGYPPIIPPSATLIFDVELLEIN